MSHCCFGKQKLAETTPLRIIVISWHHFFFLIFLLFFSLILEGRVWFFIKVQQVHTRFYFYLCGFSDLNLSKVDDETDRNNVKFNIYHHSTCNKPITSIILALFDSKQSKKNYFLKKCNITHCIPQSLHILNMIFNPRKNFYFFTMLMLTSAGCIWFYI